MKINELETQLGLTRANIRFYKKEGLLTPARKENGYREYSEEDIAILKKIIIFRKLGISLPEIKEILNGKLELSVAIENKIANLSQQIAELNGALAVCNILKNDVTANDTLDEEHYWNLIQSKEQAVEKFADMGVELKVKDWSKLYHDLKYPSWIELAENISEISVE